MEKQVRTVFGESVYLLGKDAEGTLWWLRSPWQEVGGDEAWFFGWVASYTNNKKPENSRKYKEFEHFDELFLRLSNPILGFIDSFVETPFPHEEIRMLIDYMKSYYALHNAADVFEWGHSGLSPDTRHGFLQRRDMRAVINHELLPKLLDKILELLSPEE